MTNEEASILGIAFASPTAEDLAATMKSLQDRHEERMKDLQCRTCLNTPFFNPCWYHFSWLEGGMRHWHNHG